MSTQIVTERAPAHRTRRGYNSAEEQMIRGALIKAEGKSYYAAEAIGYGQTGMLSIIADRYPHLKALVKDEKVSHSPDTHPAFLRIIPWGDSFMGQAQGDSMTGAGLKPGAMLFIEHDKNPKPGEIIVCRIGDCRLIKRLRLTPSGQVRLDSENPAYKPIRITSRTDFEIFGRLRNFANWA
jgi:hypothetical protein